jgi:transcriptional regulator with XRE-family HTH domain
MSLARRVRDYRFAKGWGPDELANRASISRTALYQIESGKTELPRAATLRRIAQALDVSMEVLLEDVDSTHSLGVRSKLRRPLPNRSVEMGPVGVDWDRDEALQTMTRSRGFESSPLSRNGTSPLKVTTAPRADLERKFRELLDSPLGDGLARLVEESHRLMTANTVSSSI